MKTKSEIFKQAHSTAKMWKNQKMNASTNYMILFSFALKIIYASEKKVNESAFTIKNERIVKETEKAILYSAKLKTDSNNNSIIEAWIPKSAINNNTVANWYFEKNSMLVNY